jgi:alpha-L-fucosidase
MRILSALVFLFLVLTYSSCAKKEARPPEPIGPLPSAAQLTWHRMEMNAFIHFTTNTFTDLEWGNGDESEKVFNPSMLDANQWVSTLKETGFKGVILTCKHHDGFCLWPSKFTNHSIKNSPYKNGKGDIVKEVSDACKKYGLKFGVYLSPWDRNHADYGKSAYVEYYRNQLKEIFAAYGPVFEMWFDGANGGTGYYGGANEKRSIDGRNYYDWPTTLNLVREMEPNVIFFSDAGPGVRWVGNERGLAGETNWNTITPDTLFAGKAGIEKLLNTGSENGTAWIPAEVDVSIRPGWFYHQKEDSLVKTPEKLFELYLTSVGRGSTLLLNVPPDKRGLFHENDIASLKGFRALLNEEFKTDLALNATISSTSHRGDMEKFSAKNLIDDLDSTYFATDDGVNNTAIELQFPKPTTAKYVILQEYIQLGQRVKTFKIEIEKDGQWVTVATGTTIGYKRIVKFEAIECSKLRVSIVDSKSCPVLATVKVF